MFGVVIAGAASLNQPAQIPPTIPTQHSQPSVTKQSTEQPKNTAILTSQSTAIPPTPVAASSKYDDIKQSVQHEYVYRMFASPNDPGYSGNWALAKINASTAWDITTGNDQTIVAVIDSGFALSHEDLSSRWYINGGESGTTQSGGRCWTGIPVSKQTNSCDDDNNGYVDDWRGWSFTNNDNNPQTGRINPTGDGIRHGTEVAGIVGASGNNGIGIATLNWNTKIMPLQALTDDGIGYTSSITAAIYYAVDNGANVINLSLGAYASDPALKNAVDYATARGVVIVAAAGNCGETGGDECSSVAVGTIAYPAAYPDVIAVGATTSSDQRASFGSYGAALDVSAPGYGVPSSTSWSAGNPTSLYSGALYGTSFASPQVASLAALIKSIRPSTTVADVTAVIDATAGKPSGMNGAFYSNQFGHGIINAGTALTIANTLNNSAISVPTLLQTGSAQSEHGSGSGTMHGSGCESAGTACTVQFTNSAGYKRFLAYSLISSGSTGWSWLSDSLDSDSWEIRARAGESVSTTPYYLLKR